MKRILYLVLITFALGASSCQKDDPAPVATLSATPSTLTFTAEGGMQTIDVEAEHVAWKATTLATWLTLANASGTADGKITVTASSHGQYQADTATILIRGEGVQTVAVKVTRKAYRKLSATPLELAFPANGGTLSFDVTAVNAQWEASTGADWLTLTDAKGSADGRVTVAADPAGTDKADEATIVIRGEDVDDVTIKVTRKAGAAVIWDRSSLSRMNLRGAVKSVSLFGSYVDDLFIENLVFDGNGMLTSFKRQDMDDYVFTLKYDSENRLSKCSWMNREIEFQYGSHGQYVYTEGIFNEIGSNYYTYNLGITDFSIWLPRFIRNLSGVTFTVTNESDPSEKATLAFRIDATGATGGIYEKFDQEEEEMFAEIAFKDGYMSNSETGGLFGGTETLTVKPSNGNLLLYTLESSGKLEVSRAYNDDRINSIDVIIGYIASSSTYDKNLNVTEIKSDNIQGLNLKMAYEYDTQGNWTEMKLSGASTDVVDRTITYSAE